MQITLSDYRTERMHSRITAELSDEGLLVRGHDIGTAVDDFFDGGDYEYNVSLDAANAAKLFDSLGCGEGTNEEKLAALKERFGDDAGYLADVNLKKYCSANGIDMEFWSWP